MLPLSLASDYRRRPRSRILGSTLKQIALWAPPDLGCLGACGG
jgi:hypothetical protein